MANTGVGDGIGREVEERDNGIKGYWVFPSGSDLFLLIALPRIPPRNVSLLHGEVLES